MTFSTILKYVWWSWKPGNEHWLLVQIFSRVLNIFIWKKELRKLRYQTLGLCITLSDHLRKYIKWICAKCDLQVKMLIPRSVLKDKKLAFSLFLMSFRFYDVIFGVKGLEMNTYKLLKLIWVQRHHEVNTCSSKYSTMPKMSLLRTFLQQKLHKTSQNELKIEKIMFLNQKVQKVVFISWGLTVFDFSIG